METEAMGRVITEATIENLKDLWDAERGLLSADKARRITVFDALVDTDAPSLSIPTRLIKQLGLTKRYRKRIRSSIGVEEVDIYDAVRLTILGRDCTVDVLEVPDDVPVLIGQIPLEFLDLVIDPRQCRVTGNPAHGGEQILELY